MKRFFSIFWALTLLLCGCVRTTAPADGETEIICVMTEYTYDFYCDGAVFGSGHQEYDYDGYGNKIEERQYSGDDLSYKIRYTYDENGNEIRQISYNCDKWIPWPDIRITTAYDSQNRKTEEVYYDFLTQTNSVTYAYDEKTNTVQEVSTEGETVRYSNVSYYGENNHLLKVVYTDQDGVESVTEHTYDEDGKERSWTQYQNGVIVDQVNYQYDAQGRELYAERLNPDGSIENTWYYTYDDENNTVTTLYTEGNTRVDTYDDSGNLIHSVQYDAGGIITAEASYTYRTLQIPRK